MEKENKLTFKEIFKSDVKRNSRPLLSQEEKPSFLQMLFNFLLSKTIPALTVYRLRFITENLPDSPSKTILAIILSTLNFWVRIIYGIDIDPRAQIGKALYIGHFGGIRIGRCRIGDYCSLHHQVEIGPLSDVDDSKPGPTIGDYVWIGGHAKIRGPVIVEGHATIAPGSVIEKHVSAHSLVMGRPARRVLCHYDNSFLL